MFCSKCGAQLPDNARFCQSCGAPVAYAAPAAAIAIPANVVPKKIVGRRSIPTNRPFTHEELLAFMQQRWDQQAYNSIITDPAFSAYTKMYVVLPATSRYSIIVFSESGGGLFSKQDKVVLSIIHTPAGAAEMIMRSIPTHNVFFGSAKIANTMSNKADREGPTEDALQRYADYMHFLLGQAGYLA